MDNVELVTETNCLKKLVNVLLDIFFRDAILMLFYNFKKVFIHVFKYEEQSPFSRLMMNYLLKASFNSMIFGCFSILNIFTSLSIVFLTVSSSSESLNFLIATKMSYFLPYWDIEPSLEGSTLSFDFAL